MTLKSWSVCWGVAISSVLLFPSISRADVMAFLNGATVIESTSFRGESDHTVSGKVDIVKKDEVYYVVLGEDFSFDGAPDPRLGFSREDIFLPISVFSSLNLDSGQQIYRLPATLTISNYDEITIWCEKFRVPLAEAKFEVREEAQSP
ncbi:MAG: DM13 domain-containing protein [Cyanobacteria bacterium P01_A01_bin.17]